MMLPQVSSELERMWLVGRSVWQITLGLRGSDTSTAVKFFGALSCASQMMRRPSGAICTDMPSPMPPKPSSMWCDKSLKFQLTVPSAPVRPLPLFTAGFLTADAFFAVFLTALAFTTFLVLDLALAATFLATFFLARFIKILPPGGLQPRGSTCSAFRAAGGGPSDAFARPFPARGAAPPARLRASLTRYA